MLLPHTNPHNTSSPPHEHITLQSNLSDASVKKRLTPGAAEAEFNFFKDPRSHGAPKGYTLHPTAVSAFS